MLDEFRFGRTKFLSCVFFFGILYCGTVCGKNVLVRLVCSLVTLVLETP